MISWIYYVNFMVLLKQVNDIQGLDFERIIIIGEMAEGIKGKIKEKRLKKKGKAGLRRKD